VSERHSRQVLFRHVGLAGQARLAAGRVLVVGVGATGGAIAASLARAGVGHITLVDRDYPERSNLQRQALFVDADVDRGLPKAIAAAAHLTAIDPDLAIRPIVADFHAGNALALATGHDVLADGTDNFATRFVLNDAAVRLNVPWVYCGAIGAHGATMTIEAGGRPCLRCLYPEAPPIGSVATCDTAGVLQPAVAAVAAVAALEVMKLLLGGEPRNHELLHVDLWDLTWQPFRVPARPDCATCGQRTFPALDGSTGGDALATTLCGREAVHLRPPAAQVDPEALARRLAAVVTVELANTHLVRFTTSGHTVTVFADGRAIVTGTDDPAVARALYARFVGL
jgi:molybdopterin-synthase adenylyltransferase